MSENLSTSPWRKWTSDNLLEEIHNHRINNNDIDRGNNASLQELSTLRYQVSDEGPPNKKLLVINFLAHLLRVAVKEIENRS